MLSHLRKKIPGFMGGLMILCMIFAYVSAQTDVGNDRVSRYEFSDILQQVQCIDCLVPTEETRTMYDQNRLEKQENDPQKALDDIEFEQTFWEESNYYYCVAGVVDAGVMNGFPRTTSPFCPGKFCGSSFLTTTEMIESLVRLLGPTIWENYLIDWKQVGLWAKDAPAVTMTQRSRVAQAIRRCPEGACFAEHPEEFDLRLRWCSLDLARCDFSAYGLFTTTLPRTPKVNVLVKEGIINPTMSLGGPYDLVSRALLEVVIEQTRQILVCSGGNDYDNDGIPNRADVCPYVYDTQRDLDGDGKGDVCDEDIDGDGIANEIGAVDAYGVIVPRLALLSEDNCLLLKNGEQKNTDDDVLGDICDPDSDEFTSNFFALKIDANQYRGTAPLLISFTQENIGLTGPLEWDFGDGTIQSAYEPAHVFSEVGIHMVKATAMTPVGKLVSIVPIEVLQDIRLQAGLEALSKDLVVVGQAPVSIQHIGIGDIQKITVRAPGVSETIDLKETISLSLPTEGKQAIELQAYNTAGERVALSQFSIDTKEQLGSQLHASSLDPVVGNEVTFTTILGGFTEEEVYQISRDFGTNQSSQVGDFVMTYARDVPGVYLVRQTIQFRDRTLPDHENIVTILVRNGSVGKGVHLIADELQKTVGESFLFTLETDNFPTQEMLSCKRTFDEATHVTVLSPKPADLTQGFAFGAPGSYPVFAVCQASDLQWYHAAMTVLVNEGNICLQGESNSLVCDLDKDGLPDLCDDDIDGDGIGNLMNLLTKELPNCAINTGNINQSKLNESTQACAGGAMLDNCSFVANLSQEDADGNGIGTACGGDGNGSTTAGGATPGGVTAGTTAGGATPGGATAGTTAGSGTGGATGTGSTAGSTTAGGATPGGATAGTTAGSGTGGATGTGSTAGSTTAGGVTAGTTAGDNTDTDGDGIGDTTDACPTTPESTNGDSDADGCPEAPADESDDPEVPENPLVEVDTCTQCPCPEADYASALWKGDRVRAMLLDEGGTIIYKYTKPEIIQEDIPNKLIGN